MKRFILCFLFGLMAFSAACGMFMLKYHVIGKEIKLSQMHKQILKNNRSIHILRAEWVNLNNPERLKDLKKENTQLESIKSSQIIRWKDIKEKDGGIL